MTATRGSVRHAVRLACPPDDVWALSVTRPGSTEWFPGIVSCTVEGDLRTVVTRRACPCPSSS